MTGYKFISDLVFEAYGKDLKELFKNAALAFSSAIGDIDKVEAKEEEEFEMKGEDLEYTLFNWLNGIITIVEAENKIFSKFEIEEVDKNHVRAKMWGETLRPEIKKNNITAPDSSNFKVEKTKEGYKATVGLKVE
jgi:SHS2 domain-containing protein